MCLPVSCLKCVVQFQAWITLLLGFASMIGAIIITIQESKGSEYFVDETNPTRGIMIAVWIFTGVLLFLGICGIVGGHKKISCLLFLYNIGNVIGFLAFLSIGIAAYVIAAEFNFTKSDCIDSSWGQKLDETYGFGDKVFCQDSCKCNYQGTNPPPQIINYAANNELPSQVQKCPSFQTEYSEYENQANLLDFAESTFNCAGWCGPQQYFVFSDVNRAVPKDNDGCFLAMTGWFYDNGNLIGDICMGLMGLLGLMIVFTCCLCCHPESKNKDGNFYARMAYYDE